MTEKNEVTDVVRVLLPRFGPVPKGPNRDDVMDLELALRAVVSTVLAHLVTASGGRSRDFPSRTVVPDVAAHQAGLSSPRRDSLIRRRVSSGRSSPSSDSEIFSRTVSGCDFPECDAAVRRLAAAENSRPLKASEIRSFTSASRSLPYRPWFPPAASLVSIPNWFMHFRIVRDETSHSSAISRYVSPSS
nr:hypothetical protein [Halorientalis regularis]